MARYIDADVLIKMLSNYYRQTQSLYDRIPQNGQVSRTRRALDELYRGVDVIIGRVPTADVVDVVRCKDCQHYEADIIAGQIGYCNEHQKGMYEHNFCSYGERKKVE